ncbi:hypothetical protein [Arthrobacter sp. A5]|uniref:hypothetical protein n=1 Tax=Arthrobacter sp. A5 TaxID=576926 RepID=UPI003DA8D108
MPGPADALGPILELMTWVGFVPGIPLLVAGWVVAKRRCPWTSTTAEVFEAGGYKGFRWSDGENAPHLSLHTAEETRGLEPGSEVVLHFDACHPGRWGLVPHRHDNTVMTVGWILTAVGIVCTLAGFILMMF